MTLQPPQSHTATSMKQDSGLCGGGEDVCVDCNYTFCCAAGNIPQWGAIRRMYSTWLILNVQLRAKHILLILISKLLLCSTDRNGLDFNDVSGYPQTALTKQWKFVRTIKSFYFAKSSTFWWRMRSGVVAMPGSACRVWDIYQVAGSDSLLAQWPNTPRDITQTLPATLSLMSTKTSLGAEQRPSALGAEHRPRTGDWTRSGPATPVTQTLRPPPPSGWASLPQGIQLITQPALLPLLGIEGRFPGANNI